MKQYENEQDAIVAEFVGFMCSSIVNCARNVIRKMKNHEKYNGGISLDELDEKSFCRYMSTEDRHEIENGIEIEVTNYKVKLNDENLATLLEELSEREAQSLILHEAYGLGYDEIGKILGISSDRAKAYKYHGLKKAKARIEKYERRYTD